MIRFVVLGLLRERGPTHGYALMKDYEARSGILIGSGSFYRTLQRLVDEGLIHIVANAVDEDPRRATHELTVRGVATIDAWLARPRRARPEPPHDELCARAALMAGSDPASARRGLDHWHEELVLLGQSIKR